MRSPIVAIENGKKLLHRRPVGRIVAAVGQPHDAVRIHDKVAAQLGRIPMDATPSSAGAHQLDVALDRL